MNVYRSSRHRLLCATVGSLIIMSGCGGGASDSGGDSSSATQVPNPSNTVTPTATPSMTPDSQASLNPSPEPQPSNSASPNSSPIPSTSPSPEAALIKPVLISENNSGDLNLSWNDSNASQYRILYWPENQALMEFHSQTEQFTLNSELHALGGRVIVEAYNSLGDSVFSEALIVEAQ